MTQDARDYARALAFARQGDLSGQREERSPLGVAVFDDDLHLRHDCNYLLVQRECTPDALAAEARRLGRPMVMIEDEALGERLAAGLPGWPVHRGLLMVLRREPERLPPRDAVVREVRHEDLRALRAAALAPYPWATPAVIEHLMAAKAAIARRVVLRCFAALVDGEVASYTDLYLGDGVAQVEDVATLERHRNKGLATAVVLRAVDEARRAGAGFVFLAASDEDWPKHLYARLGFEAVGRYVKLVVPARDRATGSAALPP